MGLLVRETVERRLDEVVAVASDQAPSLPSRALKLFSIPYPDRAPLVGADSIDRTPA